ncbi:MAG: nitroreductase family protein [Bacteroidota bacterium]
MEFMDAVRNRKTTNGEFLKTPVSIEHQHLLIEAGSRAPSHFNSQPWQFILIDDEKIRLKIAECSGNSMTRLMEEGKFFQRYKKYFRFSKEEMSQKRDGIHIDQLPLPLRPFKEKIFGKTAMSLMNSLGVPKILGQDNVKLVADSPLILAALLNKEEYKPNELTGFYCVLSLGMAIENIWLTCGTVNLGIQFISTPMEIPEAWQSLKDLLEVPEHLELMALYRIGYLPEELKRPRIDWKSNERKRLSQFVFRNTCTQPEADTD